MRCVTLRKYWTNFRAELFLLSAALFIIAAPANAAISTTPALTLDPTNQASASFGSGAVTAGDVNGDGYSDVLIGAYQWDGEATNEGRVYVYHGSATGLASTPALTLDPTNQTGADFGLKAAPAGDVNGDGYADVIIAAPYFDGETVDEGRVYVYHGSATGLSSTPALTLDPTNQTSALFGDIVSSAGDVNGDGYADVLIGATFFDAEATDEGRVYVYHGSATGLSSTPALTLDPTNQTLAFFVVAAGVGDINADGYSDVAIGAERYDAEATDEGRTYIYHGSASGLSSTPALTLDPTNQTDARFGGLTAGAGDVNGDGYADVLISAYKFDAEATDEGRLYIYHGSAGGLSATPTLTLDPTNQLEALFGLWISTAGDTNGDGYSDIAAAAYLFDGEATDEGRAYIFLGSSTGINATPSFTVDPSNQTNAQFGAWIGTAGDVNGDGYSDVVASAWLFDAQATDEGRAYLFTGSPDGLTATAGLILEPTDQAAAQFGIAVSSIGDVNGDGFSDAAVTSNNFDGEAIDEGRIYIYHGSATGLSATPALTLDPTNQTSAFFNSIGNIGDVNGDGYADAVFGATSFDAEAVNEGRAYVYYGSASGLSATPALTLDPTDQTGAIFGLVNHVGGDVNGDGYADVVISAFLYDGEVTDEGRVYIYHGSATGLSTTPTLTLDPTNQASARFGVGVVVDDFNGDGFSDLAVSADFFDAEATDEGRVYIYNGSATGLSATPALTLDPTNQTAAIFGESIATNDVNGDGYADAIFGSNLFDAEAVNEGRAYVYYGSASGLSATPALTLDPTDQFGAMFGITSGTLGDVNGDGYGDVGIGASSFDAEAANEGRTYIYHGSATGLSATPAHTLDPTNEAGAAFGIRPKTIGDVNGDGYSDVAIGAPNANGGVVDEGQLHVFYGGGGLGTPLIPQQRRTDGSVPVVTLGISDSSTGIQVRALGRTPAGAGRVQLEIETKPRGTAFNGSGTTLSTAQNTGTGGVTISQTVSGLSGDLTAYHWRARLKYLSSASPYFGGQISRWFSAGSPNLETDFLAANAAPTVTSSAQLADGATLPQGHQIAATTITFTGNESDDGATFTLEVEVKPRGTDFDGTGLLTSAVTNTGSTANVSTTLSLYTSYHWRVRTRDNRSVASAWTSFGSNTEQDADIVIGRNSGGGGGSSSSTSSSTTTPESTPISEPTGSSQPPPTITPPTSTQPLVDTNDGAPVQTTTPEPTTDSPLPSPKIAVWNRVMLNWPQQRTGAGGRSVKVGDMVTYEIYIQNSGGPITAPLVLWSPLPLGTEFLDSAFSVMSTQPNATSVIVAPPKSGLVRVPILRLPANTTVVIRFSVRVLPTVPIMLRNQPFLAGSDIPGRVLLALPLLNPVSHCEGVCTDL